MKKLLTTLLSAVVTIVIATATLASAQTSSLKGSDTFTDIPEGHWADEAIGWAVENGITTGTSETMFSPDNTLTRAQMITFLYRYHTNVAHEAPIVTTAQSYVVPEPEHPVTMTTAFQRYRRPANVVSISVLSQAPNGRCAQLIPDGEYDFDNCIWGESHWNNDWISHDAAVSLMSKIWAEVAVEGKRPSGYTLITAPDVTGLCAGNDAGCEDSNNSRLVIRRYYRDWWDSTGERVSLETVLHETAHALTTDHPQVFSCEGRLGFSACVHNESDIFRCVLDHLYVTYADRETGGVCGTVKL